MPGKPESGRLLAVGVIAGASCLGVLVVAGTLPMLAGVLALLVLFVLGLTLRDPVLLGLAPVLVALAAPWQRILALEENPVFNPVAWVAVGCLLVLSLRRTQPLLRLDTVSVMGALTAVWAVLGWVAGPGRTAGLTRWLYFWILGMLVYQLIRPAQCVRALRNGAAWVAVGLGGYATVEWLLKSNPIFGRLIPTFAEATIVSVYTYRPAATLGHPLLVADVLGLVLVLVACQLFEDRTKRRVLAVALLIGSLGLVLTGARGAMLLTGAAVCLALVGYSSGIASVGKRALVLLALVGVIAALVGPVVTDRFSGAFDTASYRQRLTSLSVASAVLARSPVFGAGPGSAYREIAQRGHAVVIPESEYASQGMGLGLPGLALVVGIPVAAAISRRRPGALRRTAPILVYILCIIGTHNVFDWWSGVPFFFTAVALIGAASSDENVGPETAVSGMDAPR
jgi:hypothetical protein